MEVSKLTFVEETKQKLQNPSLRSGKRLELRRAAICAYINSKPNGTKFRTQEFVNVAFPNGYRLGNVLSFMQRMARDKVITMEKIPKTFAYYLTVNDAKVTKAATTAVIAPTLPVEVIKGLELDQLFMAWVEIVSNPEYIKGVVEFRKYLKSRNVYLDITQ